MASNLVLKCGTATGTRTYTLKYINPDIAVNNVRSIATALVENGSCLKYPPLSVTSASIVTTSQRDIEI